MKRQTLLQAIYFLTVIILILTLVYGYPHGIENKTIEFLLLVYALPALVYIATTVGIVLFTLIILLLGLLINIASGKGLNLFD